MQVDLLRPADRPGSRALSAAGDIGDVAAFTLSFPGTAGAVRRALRRVMASAVLSSLPDDLCGSAEIVLAEVLNNIVEHAYADGTGTITLHLVRQGGGLACEIHDQGAAMPGLCLPAGRSQPLADLADLPEGGFGWFLIRSLTVGLDYRRIAGVNRLSFQLPARQSDA